MTNNTTSTAIIAVNPFAPLGALARAVQRKLHPTRLAAKVGIAAARDLTSYGQVWCKSICGSDYLESSAGSRIEPPVGTDCV